jgi:hypothetical protein
MVLNNSLTIFDSSKIVKFLKIVEFQCYGWTSRGNGKVSKIKPELPKNECHNIKSQDIQNLHSPLLFSIVYGFILYIVKLRNIDYKDGCKLIRVFTML